MDDVLTDSVAVSIVVDLSTFDRSYRKQARTVINIRNFNSVFLVVSLQWLLSYWSYESIELYVVAQLQRRKKHTLIGKTNTTRFQSLVFMDLEFVSRCSSRGVRY